MRPASAVVIGPTQSGIACRDCISPLQRLIHFPSLNKHHHQAREHEHVVRCESDCSLGGDKGTIKVSLLNEYVAHEPICKSGDLGSEALVGKNLSNEFSCFFEIGGRIITDKGVATDHVVPAELDPEQGRTRELSKPLSPNLARGLDPLRRVFHDLFVPTKVVVILFESGLILSPSAPVLRLPQCALLPR